MSEENVEAQASQDATNTAVENNLANSSAEFNFLDHISDEIKSSSNISDFKSVEDLAKSYSNLQKMVGNSVRIPSADASIEAKQDFYAKIKDVDGVVIKGSEDFYDRIGRPKAADEYKLADVVDQELFNTVPELNNELDGFKNIAHEIGLTDEQAQKLVSMRVNTLKAQTENMVKDREVAEAALKKQWGQDYENRLDAAKQVAKIYAEKHGDSFKNLINSSIGNNPALINMMAELAVVYKEQGHTGMSSAQFGMTPAMAQAKIMEKRADRGFMKAYNDDFDPGHKKAVDELRKLYEIASGS